MNTLMELLEKLSTGDLSRQISELKEQRIHEFEKGLVDHAPKEVLAKVVMLHFELMGAMQNADVRFPMSVCRLVLDASKLTHEVCDTLPKSIVEGILKGPSMEDLGVGRKRKEDLS